MPVDYKKLIDVELNQSVIINKKCYRIAQIKLTEFQKRKNGEINNDYYLVFPEKKGICKLQLLKRFIDEDNDEFLVIPNKLSSTNVEKYENLIFN